MKITSLNYYIRIMHIKRIFFPMIILLVTIILYIKVPFDRQYIASPVSDYSSLESLYSNDSRYVQVIPKALYYTGNDYEISGKVRGYIYYTIYEGRCYYFILCKDKVPQKSSVLTNYSIKARLVKDSRLLDNLTKSTSDSLNFSEKSLHDISSDIIINQYEYYYGFISFFTKGLTVICILSAVIFTYNLVIIIFPCFSSSVRLLRHYGNRRMLYQKALEEYAGCKLSAHKHLYMTDSFLIYVTHTSIDIIPLQNISWIYNFHEFFNRKHNPDKSFYPLCVVSDCKKTYKFHHVTYEQAEKILSDLETAYPSIVIGYDDNN